MTIVGLWLVASLPLAVLVGKVIAFGQRPAPLVVSDEICIDVDAFLERVFTG